MKSLLSRALLSILSVATALLLCELGTRLFLEPVDYLRPALERDEVLGVRVPPGAAGHDRWGFRNERVPASAVIVALGDSHTYGNGAKMRESWPYVLGRLTGMPAYNLGMGGYGPNQYFHLFVTKALSLNPSLVICGLYMGDDFTGAYGMTYSHDYWSFLRKKGFGKIDYNIWEPLWATRRWGKRLRNWLSRTSILYRLVFHGPVLGRLKGDLQIENTARLYQGGAALIVEGKNIREAFLPDSVLRGLDEEKDSVREGMRITFSLLDRMHQLCREKHIRFVVAVIPTKERVFSAYFDGDANLQPGGLVHQVIRAEEAARAKLFRFLMAAGIDYVDVLPALQNSLAEELYVHSGIDMHPNKNGYRVIAEAIARHLDASGGDQGAALMRPEGE